MNLTRLFVVSLLVAPLVATAVSCGGTVDDSPPGQGGTGTSGPYLPKPQCEGDMLCATPPDLFTLVVVRRAAWQPYYHHQECPAGTDPDEVYGVEPPVESTCAPCTCGAPEGKCTRSVYVYGDGSCSGDSALVNLPADETCRVNALVVSHLQAATTTGPRHPDGGPFCRPSKARPVPEAPYGGILDTCRVRFTFCHHGTNAAEEYCVPKPPREAGRLCLLDRKEVCPAAFPVRVPIFGRPDEYRRCSDCKCTGKDLRCEGGEVNVYCDTTCSGNGPCANPKVTLGTTCTATEFMSGPYSVRQTQPVPVGSCEPGQSTMTFPLGPPPDPSKAGGALCCEPE